MMQGMNHTVWQLARLAECSDPDKQDSPGAKFLQDIADTVATDLDAYDGDPSDIAHEIADAAVPVYTHEMWVTFVDLAAYQEDISEFGDYGEDMTKGAMVALYMIGRRLAENLIGAQGSEDV